ncbi:MAG: toll/interleukin-1 receptor domain-containing protein [FCB group bacterium]|jgi:hypothetical protein
MNFKLIATQIGETLKNSTTLNQINRMAKSVFDFILKDFQNENITSSRSLLIYSWILTLSEQPITNKQKKVLLIQFLKLITPTELLKDVIKIVDIGFEEDVNPDDTDLTMLKRIWGNPENFRLFISHLNSFKIETTKLKENLNKYNVSSFVAHVDIEPTKVWQDEIENALFSADALLALMTEKFHESKWTDQEIGVAIGRRIPIIAIRLGTDPYGFIGKYQALNIDIDSRYSDIVGLLLNKSSKMIDVYIGLVELSKSWTASNVLSIFLPFIREINSQQVDRFINAYKSNNNVNGSFGFNGAKLGEFGKGLKFELERITKSEINL